MTTYSFEDTIPFIATQQYLMFQSACNYARRRRKMALVWGDAGTGKSRAARQFISRLPLNPANGQPPVLYVELEQNDKTDRALYNVLISAITGQPAGNLLAKPAGEEAKRLITKYRYDTIIFDEFGFLQDSGLEAVRTLWDKIQLSMIFITMPERVAKLQQPKYKQFYSRLARIERFDGLTPTQIMEYLLPRVAQDSYLSFESGQEDAEQIVKELYTVTSGNFREIMKVLDQANEIIRLSQRKREREIAEGKGISQCTKLPVFDVGLIQAAASATKDLPNNKLPNNNSEEE
jgi:DNA transposition AAA+ family ATPase